MIMKRNAKDWGAMTHCSACSHDGSFVVRIASGKRALASGMCLYFGSAFRMHECARVLELRSRWGSGEKNGNPVGAARKNRKPRGYGGRGLFPSTVTLLARE